MVVDVREGRQGHQEVAADAITQLADVAVGRRVAPLVRGLGVDHQAVGPLVGGLGARAASAAGLVP